MKQANGGTVVHSRFEPNIHIMKKWAAIKTESNMLCGDNRFRRFSWTCEHWPLHVVIQVISVKRNASQRDTKFI